MAGWLAGCAVTPADGPVPNGPAIIYIVDQGWHTDIGIPVWEMSGPLASLTSGFAGIRFAMFGFGQRRYYMARNPGSGEMLAALFPSKSAIRMTVLRTSPPEAFPDQEVILLQLPQSSIDRITTRLWNELARKPDGAVLRLAADSMDGSVFFGSDQVYDAFYTCNTWTATLLREGGLPINARVVFAGQVMDQVALIAAVQTRRPPSQHRHFTSTVTCGVPGPRNRSPGSPRRTSAGGLCGSRHAIPGGVSGIVTKA